MGLISLSIYGIVKLLFFLFTISLGVGFLRTYVSQQEIRHILSMKRGLSGHFWASILGGITHFSPKNSIKLFYNFLESGVPPGISFSFLISSPIINEYVAILMMVFFGWKITLIYLVSGILVGTFAGLILSKFDLRKYIRKKIKVKNIEPEKQISIKKRFKIGLNESFEIIKKLWIFLIFGIFLNLLIQQYMSEEMILRIVQDLGYFGVPIAILIGIPFSGTGSAIIPIAVALFQKGIPLGTALGFLIAVVALSIPRAMELRKIMETRLIILFFTIISVSIMIISFLINFIQEF